MSVKGNDHDTSARKQGHIRNCRKIICIYIQLELWFKIKTVFMQESGIQCIISRHAFDLCFIQHQSPPLALRYWRTALRQAVQYPLSGSGCWQTVLQQSFPVGQSNRNLPSHEVCFPSESLSHFWWLHRSRKTYIHSGYHPVRP